MNTQTVTVYRRGKRTQSLLSANSIGLRNKEAKGENTSALTHTPRTHRNTMSLKTKGSFPSEKRPNEISDEQAAAILANQVQRSGSEQVISDEYAEQLAQSMTFEKENAFIVSDDYAETIAQRLSPEAQNHFVDNPAPKRFGRSKSGNHSGQETAFDQSERDMQLMEFQNKGGNVIGDKPTYVNRSEDGGRGRVTNHLGRRGRNRHQRHDKPQREKMSFISHSDPQVDFSAMMDTPKQDFVSHDDPKPTLQTHETPKHQSFNDKTFKEVEFEGEKMKEFSFNLLDFALDN